MESAEAGKLELNLLSESETLRPELKYALKGLIGFAK